MSAVALASAAAARFALPASLIATVPPEARGLARDAVRLMVVTPKGSRHTRFRDIGEHLRRGDLLVVNTSATVAAAVDARKEDGAPVVVHVAMPNDIGNWIIEVRRPDQSGPVRDLVRGERLSGEGGVFVLLAPLQQSTRLWRAAFFGVDELDVWIQRAGRPISYSRSDNRWPLRAYQTVFARHPGSAEMPSAARPFSTILVTDLVARGISFATVTLHAGLSSLEHGELPPAERFSVSAHTARMVNATRAAGGRVIAVGTTVARALETVASRDGSLSAGCGWTDLVLSANRPARAVDGIVTGWHEPESTHLDLLESIVDVGRIDHAYESALHERYLWHEFGDSCLFVADRA
ncbi:MAG: S-adenosylmethionine:tRNA ribosyltransferase-isomerase [Candidatus Dormibacteraeota bacterium]|nr:S-adenosylmethionine:tRNA ribosyltransferase-isomerase [Candidatus Dormibacteraeota bacterium]